MKTQKTTKRLFKFTLMMLLTMLLSTNADAYDFEVDGIYYGIHRDNHSQVSVTYQNTEWIGHADQVFYSDYAGDVVIPSTVTYDGVTYSVTAISDHAFSACPRVTSVTIPASVNSIGDFAFTHCSGLTSLNIPASVTSIGYDAFDTCNGLTSITVEDGNPYYDSRDNCNALIETSSNILIKGCVNTVIPNTITEIGDHAFNYCNITSLDIPASVTKIGANAFSGCNGLTSVRIPASVTTIGTQAFDACHALADIDVPNSVTFIGMNAFDATAWYENQPDGMIYLGLIAYKYKGTMPEGTSVSIKDGTLGIAGGAFNWCYGLAGIDIPSSVVSIGQWAFGYCLLLTHVEIPNSVAIIGASAFKGCENLSSVTLGNSLETIGSFAFAECISLTGITIPRSVTTIGEQVFVSCDSLARITVENGNANYDSRGNCNAVIETSSRKLISGCKNTVIPISVDAISDHAFSGCHGLTEVAVPNSVTAIGDNAFEDCNNLRTVTLGTSVATIGKYAFNECRKLTTVTIPNSVTTIGEYIFLSCRSLTDVYSYIIDPSAVTIEYMSFGNINNYSGEVTLHVPCGTMESYKEMNRWYMCFDRIVEMDPLTGDVDADGKVGITDVVGLIDLLLGGTVSALDYPAADVNGNGEVNVGDVTDLIDSIISANL